MMQMMSGKGMPPQMKEAMQAMQKGQKRKAGEVEEVSPKNKLLNSVQLIITKNHQRNM